jgi:hypothetical protein
MQTRIEGGSRMTTFIAVSRSAAAIRSAMR